MRRGLFKSLAILSLVLCAATTAMWLRSHAHRDAYPDVMYRPTLGVQSIYGRLCIYTVTKVNGWPMVGDFTWTGFGRRPTVPSGYQFALQVDDHPLPVDWQNKGLALVYCTITRVHPPSWQNALGFELIDDSIRIVGVSGCHTQGIAIPYWALCVFFLVMPACFGFSVVKARRRKRAGLCVNCGYDIHVTPDRCPECGWSASTAG